MTMRKMIATIASLSETVKAMHTMMVLLMMFPTIGKGREEGENEHHRA